MWKPWLRRNSVHRRRKANRRKLLVYKIIFNGFVLLANPALGLNTTSSAPTINMLCKWSKILWFSSKSYYSRLCALMSLSLVQSMLGLNLELFYFFNKFTQRLNVIQIRLSTSLVTQRKKRFFFIKQQPKRYVLWYWAALLAQSTHTPNLLSRPSKVLHVLCPVSFFLKKKRLKSLKK